MEERSDGRRTVSTSAVHDQGEEGFEFITTEPKEDMQSHDCRHPVVDDLDAYSITFYTSLTNSEHTTDSAACCNMRGLPFPAEALFNREQSHDFTSSAPGTNGVGVPPVSDVVPLDPTLSGPSSAPAYFQRANRFNGVNGHVITQADPIHQLHPVSPTYPFGQYPQGPEGDPFAPPPHFFPGPAISNAPDDRSQASQRPIKRGKRKPRREQQCCFCTGDDIKNKTGEPERMVTCVDCGRSGHPSCMQLGEVRETLFSYTWKCYECKTCEVCNEKGDDARILFCDKCDRGWHTYCLNPPLDENPEGSWFCPQCATPPESATHDALGTEFQPGTEQGQLEPQIAPELQIDPALRMEEDTAMDIDPVLREDSVASSTVPSEQLRQSRARGKARSRKSGVRDRKGKGRALVLSDEEEEEVEAEAVKEDDDEEMYPPMSTPRGRAPLNSRRKSNARNRRTTESIPDDVEPPSPPLRPQKRMKLTVRSPSPLPRQRQSAAGRPKVVVRLKLPGKGKGRDEDEEDEVKKGMFDDILDEKDRDTSRTSIFNSDKERFEKARQTAEAKLIPPRTIEPLDLSSIPGPSSGRFPLRSTIHQIQQQHVQALLASPNPTSPSPSTPGPSQPNVKFDPSVLRIRTIRFGPYDIQTWYDAPFPEEFSNIPEGRLWICEFCLKYMRSRFGAQRHRLKCKCRHPPGDEIYRDGSISIFEVDGRKNKIYCQHLCLLSKMFLDHKSLFYDVEPFLFYVITEVDDMGARFVGYFSKEKRSSKDLNLSCIMTLPVRQRQGWGNLLIDFSYLLSRKEHKCGTPERPLSALGAIGYRKYWTLTIMRYLHNAPSNPRLEDISAATGMTLEDIYLTLLQKNMITVHERPSSPVRPSPGRSMKVNRTRKNGVARRNLHKAQPADEDQASKAPFIPPTSYEIYWDADEVRQFLEVWNSKGYLTLKPEKLKWTPFLLTRADKLATPLEDVLMSGPIDVENTPTTPGPARSETRDATASVSDSVTASASAFDMSEARSDSHLVTPTSKSTITSPGADDHEAGSSTSVADTPHAPSDFEQSATEPDGSPTPTPSPPPMRQSRLSINGLEALAAVAFAVSKANPVDVRRSSAVLPLNVETSRPGWTPKAMNGSAPEPVRIMQAQQPMKTSPTTPSLVTRSRSFAAKKEDVTVSCDMTRGTVENDEWTPQRPQPDEHPHHTGHIDEADSHSHHSPTVQRASVEDDAELAARLAREEGVRRRALRSTSNSTVVTSTLASRDSRPKEAPRKRQKAASVREPTPPTPVSPDRPTTRRQAQVIAIESAKSGRMTRRQSSRLTGNGGDNEVVSMGSAPAKRASRLNGASKAATTATAAQSPTKSTRRQASQRNGRTTRARHGQSPSEQSFITERNDGEMVDVDAEGESDVDAEGEEAELADSAGDVSVIERESIVVSNGAKGGTGEGVVNGDWEDSIPDPVENQIVANHTDDGMPNAPEESVVKAYGVDEGDDIDAEGEPDDEDADGEPDPDVFP